MELFSKESRRKVAAKIVPFIGYLLVRLVVATCKKKFTINFEVPKTPIIFAFWHDELLLQPLLYQKFRETPNASVMISEHFDGEIIAKLVKYFGLDSIRGSARKGGARVLLQAIKQTGKGQDIAITPDGPKGPRHSVAEGIVLLAQKTGLPVVCYNYDASKKWRLKSWDRFIIPKPFCELNFIAAEPFYLTGLTMEEAKLKVAQELLQNAAKE
ncbi:MAG: hypothetical protein RL154_218 [Pseudomonadota bacterium]|jgi:lysophospholipid acyltransferase (LPLAT)-like uncharacterized protein